MRRTEQRKAVKEARQKGRHMAQLALDNADRESPAFSDLATQFTIQYLRANGPRTGEVITNAALRYGLKPHDARAFGGVYNGLQRRGLIQCKAILPRFKGHGSIGARLWALTRKGRSASA